MAGKKNGHKKQPKEGESNGTLAAETKSNILKIVGIERRQKNNRTFGERLSDTIALFCGSMVFVYVHIAWFATWILYNSVLHVKAFDPFPYSLLNLVVVLEAVFLTSVVLMTQNHMTRLAERHAHLDLQVNLLAEQELTAMLHMLHGLCTKAGVHVAIRDARVEQLLAETNIQEIAIALDRGLDAPLPS